MNIASNIRKKDDNGITQLSIDISIKDSLAQLVRGVFERTNKTMVERFRRRTRDRH